jgi:vesicle coat complex subunit
VVANAVIALEEVLSARGGIMLTQDIAYTLLNRLKDFTEWNQSAVMSVLLRYSPSDPDEAFDILVWPWLEEVHGCGNLPLAALEHLG